MDTSSLNEIEIKKLDLITIDLSSKTNKKAKYNIK